MYVIYISIRLYLNVFILECFYHVFQGPTGEQHIAEWATLVKYIEINIIRGFGGKGYPLLGIFSQENDVFVYFSDKMGEITKVRGMFRDFPAKNRDPCLGTLGREVTH